MLHKVKATIRKFRMINPGETVVVAISGGPDSMALFIILDTIAREQKLHLIIAHLNHGLRAEAVEEERYVRNLAQKAGWPYESETIDTLQLSRQLKKSLEDTARVARYEFLNRVAHMHEAEKIALGHHQGDQAETLLMNLLRGSGAEGMKGMLPIREGRYIRPLLFVRRKDILKFLQAKNQPFVVDRSNDLPVYLRNRIRNRLLPLLRQDFNPNLDAALGHLAEIMRLDDDFMSEMTEKALQQRGIIRDANNAALPIEKLQCLHEALQNRVIKRLLETISPTGNGISYAHVAAVRDLLASHDPSASLDLPFQIRVRRIYDRVLFSRNDEAANRTDLNIQIPDFSYSVDIPGIVHIMETETTLKLSMGTRDNFFIPEFSTNRNIAFLDFDCILLPLSVRNIRPGDRMRPLGMKGRRKIKSILIDEKIPRDQRRRVPLVVDGRSILWLGGGRLSETVRVTDQTTRILKVEII